MEWAGEWSGADLFKQELGLETKSHLNSDLSLISTGFRRKNDFAENFGGIDQLEKKSVFPEQNEASKNESTVEWSSCGLQISADWVWTPLEAGVVYSALKSNQCYIMTNEIYSVNIKPQLPARKVQSKY